MKFRARIKKFRNKYIAIIPQNVLDKYAIKIGDRVMVKVEKSKQRVKILSTNGRLD